MKKYDIQNCRVISNQPISPDIFSMTVEAGPLADKARPGQFALLFVPGKTLRRPFSFCEIGKEKGIIRFVFQVRGSGTARLARIKPGESVNLLAPLGHGFDLSIGQRALFLGGGIGLPPLLAAASFRKGKAVLAAGFRTRENVILENDFKLAGCPVRIATDDGSYGQKGLVTDLASDLAFDVIYACGPRPMLHAAAKLAESRGIPCQVSMEERMACGIGACLGCAIKLRGISGDYYGHVCCDGPVFDASSIVWED